jgi:hypothetical protein
MPPSTETVANDLRDVVLHEVCHAMMVMPRCPAFVIMFQRNQDENLKGREKTWHGQVFAIQLRDNDAFKDAIHGWAGLVGDYIEKDRATAVDKAWTVYEQEKETISPSDLENIEKLPLDQRRKATGAAFDILVAKWNEIKDVQARISKFVEKNITLHRQVNVFWRENEGWVDV